jgi:hypothetical protein
MDQSENQTPSVAQAPPQPPAPGLLSRAVGIIVSPKETFAKVVQQPKWFGMLLVLVIVSAGLNFAFLSTEVGRQAMLDNQVRQTESLVGPVSDQQYQGMERMLPFMKYMTAVGTLIAVPIVMLIMSGILFAVFTMLGGGAAFKQLFSVVVHAGAVSVLGQVIIVPLNYMRESMSSATNLGVLLPMLPEGSFLARFSGMVDLFTVWWVIVLAIGLGVLYRRKTTPIAVSLFAVYGIIAVGVAAFMAMRSGS